MNNSSTIKLSATSKMTDKENNPSKPRASNKNSQQKSISIEPTKQSSSSRQGV
jgi:hypothetical protein